MDNLSIEPYKAVRDKASITAMLCGEALSSVFQPSGKGVTDGVFVARYNGETVAFLSFDGYKRRALTTIYVNKAYRRIGIGTALMAKADQLLGQNKIVERSIGACMDGDSSSLQFLYKHGCYISYSSYAMEREDVPLPESNITVRQYDDEDYVICHNIGELVFFQMHEQVGILPSYYYPPNETERKRFADDRNNRFVMLIEGEIAGIGIINGSELSHISVRPDLQSRGYGRAFISYLVNEIMRRGEKIVTLAVVKGNPAINLYKSIGFKEKSLNHWMTKYYRPDTRLSRPPSDIVIK